MVDKKKGILQHKKYIEAKKNVKYKFPPVPLFNEKLEQYNSRLTKSRGSS